MDMSNLSNTQQATLLDQQLQQQRLLSNQAAANAASQFNATSENQTNQFMSNLYLRNRDIALFAPTKPTSIDSERRT